VAEVADWSDHRSLAFCHLEGPLDPLRAVSTFLAFSVQNGFWASTARKTVCALFVDGWIWQVVSGRREERSGGAASPHAAGTCPPSGAGKVRGTCRGPGAQGGRGGRVAPAAAVVALSVLAPVLPQTRNASFRPCGVALINRQ
jgi:hypothetical protein